MQNSLTKYRLGLGAIGVFTLVIVGVVLMQAGATRTDSNTYKSATKIADKLDVYVSRSNKIPSSLAVAGVNDVPTTVTYKKLSSSSYKFCVTYKTESSGFNTQDVAIGLLTGDFGSSDYGTSSSDTAYLYLPSTHHKGENCQTVKPYLGYSQDYNYSLDESQSTPFYQ